MERRRFSGFAVLALGMSLAACGSALPSDTARNSSSLSDVALAASSDLNPPSAPSNLLWNGDGMTVTLTWGPSTDDVGVTGYDLSYGSFFLGTFSDTSVALIGFKAGTPYVFSVKARDAAGNLSVASNTITVLLAAPKDTTPPSAPSNLRATSVTDTRVNLSWAASTDDVGVVVYQISAGATIVGTAPASTSATISNLTPGTAYLFTVTAVDAAGNVSPSSNAVQVTPTAKYTLTIAAGSGGTTYPAAGTYSYDAGASVSITALPDANYAFSSWSGAATGTTNPVVVVMDGNKTLTPVFTSVTPTNVSVNAGGTATGTFLADQYFSGGTTYSNTSTIDTSLVSSVPQAIFQSERYGEFTYTVPGLSAGGAYVVTLYFAETYLSAAGGRVFDVVVNGTTALGGFDIYAAAGGQNKAVAQSVNATATGGQIVIQFTKGTSGVENPKVCGIAVAPGSLPTYSLTVTKSGSGTGTISGGAIACGTMCTANVVGGSTVVLTASPGASSSFTSWGGACSGTAPVCTVKMDAAKTVTATFGPGGTTGDPVPSAGCGKAATLTSGTKNITSAGQNRSFIIRVPDNYDPSHPYRLIFGFHWNGGSGNDVDSGGTSGYTWSYYGLREQANNSTIFVAPNGLNAGWANSNGQDLTFVDDMVSLIENGLCVDKSRVFSMGFSYGGGMSFELACARAKVFRAVAVYAGAQLSGCDGGNDPIAYIGFHSISDPTCSIAGGRGLRDRFVKNNGCTAQNPPEPAAGTTTHIVTEYAGCKPGYPVVWAPFSGPGHTPAPVDGQTNDSGGGDKTWTKGVAWKFFTRF